MTDAHLDALIDEEPTTFAVFAHCASGYTELVNIEDTLDAAKRRASRELVDSPVTPCGTGGVRWCEIFGPGIPESIGVERNSLGGVVEVTP
jgi:hypothetical protein